MDERRPAPRGDEGGDARSAWISDRTTFQRVYDVLVGVREPATAAEFAEWADCSETGARSALDQLVEMGVAERREGRPAGYRRNDGYFRWKRIEELAGENGPAELRATVRDLMDRDRELQERYGVPEPNAVAVDDFDVDDHEELHDVWEALSEWRTVRRDVRLLRRAIHRAESGNVDDEVPV